MCNTLHTPNESRRQTRRHRAGKLFEFFEWAIVSVQGYFNNKMAGFEARESVPGRPRVEDQSTNS